MHKHRKLRALAWALACLIALIPAALAQEAGIPEIECGVAEIQKYGNLQLDISGNALLDMGYAYGDVINVEVAGNALQMPVTAQFSDVDNGALVCVAKQADDPAESTAVIAINMGDLATFLGIAEKVATDGDPGFRWDYAAPYQDGVPVRISMAEQGAYVEGIALHQLTRSDDRADYPDLTDEEFANFRNVATTGMGANALYRSSSPVNPELGRNKQADAATNAAGIRTVLNFADSEKVMKGYEDYAYTYYSQLDVIALDVIVDFASENYRNGLVKGLRFIAGHEGPYLIHCTEGKDRAGFATAILECLMGATAGEVIADYMVSYYNYFGIRPGDEKYDAIANSYIKKTLAAAFGVDDIAADGVDLAACAEAFLEDNGMTAEEIAAVKARLAADIK